VLLRPRPHQLRRFPTGRVRAPAGQEARGPRSRNDGCCHRLHRSEGRHRGRPQGRRTRRRREGQGLWVKREESALAKGKTTEEKSKAVLDRITPSAAVEDFAGVDFVIEAVFESVPVKQQVFGEIQNIVEPDAVLGSNTSTLPITELATGVDRDKDFIGVHFFSPADKMPLVEIIRGENTSD